MKRMNPNKQIIWVQISKNRFRKRIRRKQFSYQFSNEQRSGEHQLSPPKVMSFKKNYTETVRFLDEFRTIALNKNPYVTCYVDLTNIEEVSLPVAVVLTAEFERWKLVRGKRMRPRKIAQWKRSVFDMFSSLGMFELLGIGKGHRDAATDNFVLFPLKSGLKSEGQKIHALQNIFKKILDGFTQQPALYVGLIEAMENAISHAYPSEYEPKHRYAGHRWWGASCLDIEKERLRFFVYDQGSGIPFTVPRSGLWEQIRQTISETSAGTLGDHAFILEKAFEVGRTNTGESHRGLGLGRMLAVTEAGVGCRMRVISGFGEVLFENGKLVEKLTHTHHVGGTFIEWSIPSNIFTEEGAGA